MQKIIKRETNPANEFASPLFHIVDYNDMTEETKVETSAEARESELAFYRDRDYEIVSVEEKGRFAARFHITLKRTTPKVYTFTSERERDQKYKELKKQYSA